MTRLLDPSRPPRKHLHIVGVTELPDRVRRFRRLSFGRTVKGQHWLVLSGLLAILGVAAYVLLKPGSVDTIAPTVLASTPIPNCATARALGLAPAYRGDPGYRSYLDRDGDGIACEPYRRRW
jgi:Excalibur calcium-binding domain